MAENYNDTLPSQYIWHGGKPLTKGSEMPKGMGYGKKSGGKTPIPTKPATFRHRAGGITGNVGGGTIKKPAGGKPSSGGGSYSKSRHPSRGKARTGHHGRGR